MVPYSPPASPFDPAASRAPKELHLLAEAIGEMFSPADSRLCVAYFVAPVATFGPKMGAAIIRTAWRDLRPFYRTWRRARARGDAHQAAQIIEATKAMMWAGGQLPLAQGA